MESLHKNSVCYKFGWSYYMTERCAKYQGWLQTKQSGSVTAKINDQVTRTIMENREMLKSLIGGVIFCARQNIGLWGHRDSLDKGNYRYSEGCGDETAESQHFNNIGNFRELINLLCLENKFFSSKLNNMPQNAKCTSNIIQNDMLQAVSSLIT
ncbi:hypothetical protein PR048_004337 [Dryococelus australis]|uniref:Uncharacterized protein n=1 Tax=Dryococelus australis TaxID=614101 RepID=A0ABQ9I556_9NEOP|nr:hypothetical protein PR048_004337 [Dryococelus australis]